MNVSIYNASWSTFGGGEKYICTIADVLSREERRDITLLIDKPFITAEKLRQFFNLDLSRVRIRRVAHRNIRREMRKADLAFIVSNFKPFGTPGRKTIYILQIPYHLITLQAIAALGIRGDFREAAKDVLRRFLLRDARRADMVIVYSSFVQEVLRRDHDLASEILYPPIDDFALGLEKKHAILSVGRFFTGLYNDKRYDILIEAFKKLCARLPDSSWQYWLVGSCGADDRSQRHLAWLREIATGFPIQFYVNSPYTELRRLYNQATIFWHAAGYGVDETEYPERMEHFGMSTVEAMSASCAPVVINRGGQKEIVSHGESGYLWNTLEDLVESTALLMQDRDLLYRVQQCARKRFMDFDHDHFVRRLRELVGRKGGVSARS